MMTRLRPGERLHRSTEPDLWLQLAYLFLYWCGVFCSLWLKGHPWLMVSCLGLGPLSLALSRLPFKWFPSFFRQLFQLALGAWVVVWCKSRLSEVSLDIVLVEANAALGLGLFLGRRLREHRWLFLMSIGLIGYGGLSPGRPYFFPVFVLSLVLCFVSFYLSRTSLLSNLGSSGRGLELPRQRVSWGYAALHFVVAVSIMVLLLGLLPQSRRLRTHGLLPVSFTTEQDMRNDPRWTAWLKASDEVRLGEDGNKPSDGKSGDESSNPIESEQAKRRAPFENARTFDSQTGNGLAQATIGTELVFRAVANAKLYWVMQLYDTYDGRKWTQSRVLKSGSSGIDRYVPVRTVEVPQHIRLERAFGYRLPHYFRARRAMFRNTDEDRDTPLRQTYVLQPDSFSLLLVSRHRPPLPWSYRVQSYVANPETPPPQKAWREPSRNYGWTYLWLPPELISERVSQLALEITAPGETPYEKACLIRDYLRANYKYDLSAPAVPEGREVVDYFLFESRVGYCQHFAQAFTVLARLAGLHSRLATGYSPGNYNLLSNTFEVYEYHAHAWTQIFLEPYGWMTFDGVAPGDLRLETTPKVLTGLLDPFGSEWKSHPPELTAIPLPNRHETMEPEKLGHGGDSNLSPVEIKPSLFSDIYERAALDNSTTDPTMQQLLQASMVVIHGRLASLWAGISTKFRELWDSIVGWLIRAWRAFWGMALVGWIVLSTSLAAVFVFLWNRRRIVGFLSYWVRFWRHRRRWRRGLELTMSPREKVLWCYSMVCGWLELASVHRPAEADALEWASEIGKLSDALASDYRVIASAALEARFSNHVIGFPIANETLNASRRVVQGIQKIPRAARSL